MQSDNEKIITEKSIKVTIGESTSKPSNPDEEKIFSEGQKYFAIKVSSPDIQKSEYSKSNPNIVE